MKGATLNAGVINNDDGPRGHGSSVPGNFGLTSYYVGATVPTPVQALKFGAAWDYLDVHDAHAWGNWMGCTDSSAWNVALYASIQANDKLSFNLRGEHFELNAGGGAINGTPFDAMDEVTATAQYKIWDNVLSRVEFRWDHVEHGTAFDNSAYDMSGTSIHDNAFMVALNLIYQF